MMRPSGGLDETVLEGPYKLLKEGFERLLAEYGEGSHENAFVHTTRGMLQAINVQRILAAHSTNGHMDTAATYGMFLADYLDACSQDSAFLRKELTSQNGGGDHLDYVARRLGDYAESLNTPPTG